MRGIAAKYHRTWSCCGLMEIGDFNGSRTEYLYGNIKTIKHQTTLATIKETRLGFICVTRHKDKTHVAWLKAAKFTRVGSWRNPNTKKVLTLWAYLPKPKKRKRNE